MEDIIKTDNGWCDIRNSKPNGEEEVIVILEREGCDGCLYDFNVCKSIYRHGCSKGYFLKENDAWKVRYWRQKELYPYPNGVVEKEIAECKKHKVNPYRIIEHQKLCGIDVEL